MSSARHASRSRPPLFLRWVGVGCALAIWLLGVFATSSQLHGALHADAGHADHICAITLFSEGFEHTCDGADPVVAPALFPAGDRIAVSVVAAAGAKVRLPPVCGPPIR